MSRTSTALTAVIGLAVGGLAMFGALRHPPAMTPSQPTVAAPAAPTRFDVAIASRSTVRVLAFRIDGSWDDSSYGTGIVIGPCRVLTSLHVVADPTKPAGELSIGDPDSNLGLYVELERTDPTYGLAIVRGPSDNAWCRSLQPLPLGAGAKAKAGDAVYAIAAEARRGLAVALGTIQQRAVSIEGIVHMEVAIAVPPGASGGPLFDNTGHVIGLIDTQWRPEGTAFALPIEFAATILGDTPSVELRQLIADARPIFPTRAAPEQRYPPTTPSPSPTKPRPVGELLFDEFQTDGSRYRARFRLNVPSGDASTAEFVLTIGELEVPLGKLIPRQILQRHSENVDTQSFEYTGKIVGRWIYSGTKVSLKRGDLAANTFIIADQRPLE
jgi:S1-C subfamily serine protease